MLEPRDVILFDEVDKDGPQTSSRTYSVGPADLNRHEVVNVGPVSITASVSKGNLPAEYLVEGTVRFTADFACARCLEPYPFASSSIFHLRFEPRPERPQQEVEEVEISPDELDIEFYAERAISLRDLAIEQIQLSIPMKPLCEESCLGLCPQCGVNRNRETCSCEGSIAEERWGALREIREVLKKRES
jgi:DUF177 domain-containing protein